MQNLKEVVRPFYTELLSANTSGNGAEIIDKLIADNFQHINTAETKNKAQFKEHVPGLFQLIPNLKTDVQEMLQDGNRVIVRSITSGNPVGNFFGIECDGSRAFSVMAIDVHTIENNQITKVYHLEEWTTAFKQLQA
jgi:predicted ester cyclase